jgi:hypothetical protein
LDRAVRERLEARLERMFRLAGLIYSPHDIYSVYYNCRIKPALRPAAIEFLDNILEPPLKASVVPRLEAAYDPEKPIQVQQEPTFVSLESLLSMLVSGDDPWLTTIAAELQNKVGEMTDDTRERRVITG